MSVTEKPAVLPAPASAPPGAIVADPPSLGGLSNARRLAVCLVPVLLGAASYVASVAVVVKNPADYPKAVAPYYAAAGVFAPSRPEPDGPRLYAAHCANCHGTNGDGRGVAQLTLKARHFGFDKFKFASTRNGVPTDDDLRGLIRRGLPGSPMPAFDAGKLTDDELAAVIGHVRTLTQRGAFERLVAKAKKEADEEGETFDLGKVAAKLSQQAAAATVPGEPLSVPAFDAATAAALDHGKQLFMTTGGCAACHGPTGKGDGPQAAQLVNEDKTPNRPRDLTSGLFKGGRDPGHVYARVTLGIPGTPMPAAPNTLQPKDIQALVAYVLSLSPDPNPAGQAVATAGGTGS